MKHLRVGLVVLALGCGKNPEPPTTQDPEKHEQWCHNEIVVYNFNAEGLPEDQMAHGVWHNATLSHEPAGFVTITGYKYDDAGGGVKEAYHYLRYSFKPGKKFSHEEKVRQKEKKRV